MCLIKFSIELNIFQIDDKDLTTDIICEKWTNFKMDDASVSHLPIYEGFLRTNQCVSTRQSVNVLVTL